MSGRETAGEHPLWGIALRLGATMLFAVMSLFVRLASAEAPVGQIVFHRSFWALLPVLLYLAWRRQLPQGFRTRHPLGHVRRSIFGCASMFFSFLSLSLLPLALATSLSFLAPLLAVPAGILFLRERPGALVGAAALAGFGGVLLMLAPAFVGPRLDQATLIGVAAGLATAATTLAARVEVKRLTATELPGTIALYFSLVCALGGLATWPLGWAVVSPTGFIWLIGAGLAGGLAHICMTEAVARAPISLLAPFEYTALIWAVLLDLLVFGLLPVPLSMAGAGLVVLAALTVAFADRLGGRRKRG
ncbi:DMT family transporter [Falsiroseomonas selenitidurans]|uniref:DMT family transporter n=1 Tax=Falsiroseomonas selenitidurans TaxID=2716335 RepID=A0ABX1EDG9_9PROT|nr:DMT family transporter [Falsiroseomonas selenitidurans]NKC33577.1 DMT family transporter [Falsiroseomonas selenitidurans]